jgi:hypothetical protein
MTRNELLLELYVENKLLKESIKNVLSEDLTRDLPPELWTKKGAPRKDQSGLNIGKLTSVPKTSGGPSTSPIPQKNHDKKLAALVKLKKVGNRNLGIGAGAGAAGGAGLTLAALLAKKKLKARADKKKKLAYRLKKALGR